MQPSILYIFTDQQHHRAMRCAGNPDVVTPAMGRLAREGVMSAGPARLPAP